MKGIVVAIGIYSGTQPPHNAQGIFSFGCPGRVPDALRFVCLKISGWMDSISKRIPLHIKIRNRCTLENKSSGERGYENNCCDGVPACQHRYACVGGSGRGWHRRRCTEWTWATAWWRSASAWIPAAVPNGVANCILGTLAVWGPPSKWVPR